MSYGFTTGPIEIRHTFDETWGDGWMLIEAEQMVVDRNVWNNQNLWNNQREIMRSIEINVRAAQTRLLLETYRLTGGPGCWKLTKYGERRPCVFTHLRDVRRAFSYGEASFNIRED